MRLWTFKEEEVLKRFYGFYHKNYILKLLPNRTWEAIVTQASRLGLRRTGHHKYIRSLRERFLKQYENN